jgi:hypothetical protein
MPSIPALSDAAITSAEALLLFVALFSDSLALLIFEFLVSISMVLVWNSGGFDDIVDGIKF